MEKDKGDPESWRRLNPGWAYRFWTDDDLRDFMAVEFPGLLDLYLSYPRPVQRADLARYCILARLGGVYADIDTRCLAALEPLAGDPRVILCEEPAAHQEPARLRGIGRLYFNGTMASPPGHPFWEAVIEACRRMAPRRHGDVLDTTGPLVLSAVVARWPDPSQLALNSCNLFAGLSVQGRREPAAPSGPYGKLVLSEHLWQGSWYRNRRESWRRRKIGRLRQLRHELWPRPRLRPEAARAAVDMALLQRPLAQAEAPPRVAILIPVRDAAEFLERNLGQIRALDHPKDRLHLLYGEGGSTDGSEAVIAGLQRRFGAEFASFGCVPTPRNGPALARDRRWYPRHQYRRRAGLAMARNDLLAQGLRLEPDWFLWLDADVVGLPPDLIARLLAARGKIVTPDCLREGGDGGSYDLNAFLNVGRPSRADYFRHIRHGLFQPPPDCWFRRHLADLRYLDRVPLDGVGGTALLVHADVHRAGLAFPEIPYRDLLETEAFGALARDLGVTPVGLPNLAVIHAST